MKLVEKEKIKSTPIKFIIFPRQEETTNEPTMNTPPQSANKGSRANLVTGVYDISHIKELYAPRMKLL